MRPSFRAALAAAAAIATLAFAGSALAANTATFAVWHTPMLLAGSQSTTLHLVIPQADDPIAAINIYVPSGYQANLGAAAGTTLGEVTASAFAHDQGLTLPLGGPVVADSPANWATQIAECGLPSAQAVWVLHLSVAGQEIQLPLFVNPTAPAEAQLGAYKLTICLPPWDVPAGTPGRSAFGAQVLEAKFTVNGVFTTPTSGGLATWDALFTPYTPGTGRPNPAGTFEARALVPLPTVVSLHVRYAKKTNAWALTGQVSEGGLPVAGKLVGILRGLKPSTLKRLSSTRTNAKGAWKTAGHLKPKKPTYFQATISLPERDATAQGCQNAVAPAGCVSATLSPWSGKSVIIRLRP